MEEVAKKKILKYFKISPRKLQYVKHKMDKACFDNCLNFKQFNEEIMRDRDGRNIALCKHCCATEG